MRKLADSKPVHAAAGAGVLASETLRELTAWLTKMRNEASAGTLSSRASGYISDRPHHGRRPSTTSWPSAAQKALNGRSTGQGKGRAQRQAKRAEPPAVQQVLTLGPTPGDPARRLPRDRARSRGLVSARADRGGSPGRWLSAHIVPGPDNLEACSPLEL